MMFRILYINSYAKARIHLQCYSVFSIKKNPGICFKATTFPISYSTLPKPKMIYKYPKKENKIKLKIKPYEDLLKVLEVRVQELKINSNILTISKESETPSVKEASNEFKFITENKNLSAYTNVDEGIYTVKGFREKRTKKKKNESSKDKKKKSQSKSSKDKSEALQELEKATKDSYAMRTLKSYIEVCINAKEVGKAQKALEYYREKYKMKNKVHNVINIELYNLLISGWAAQGRLDKVKHIFSLISNDNLVPDLQSYAGYLEGIARTKRRNLDEAKNILNEMKSKGFTPRDMLESCIFVEDQKEKLVEILGFFPYDLRTPTYVPEKAYSCKLLENLNDKSFERKEGHFNFCFNEKDIQDLSVAQLDIESSYSIKIKSVDAVGNVDKKVLKSRKYLKECEDIWREKLTSALKNIKTLERESHGIYCPSIYPYLAVIDVEILVNLLLQEVRMLAETGEFFSPNEKVLFRELGIKVMNHYFIWLNKRKKITDKVIFLYQKYLQYLLDPKLFAEYSPREYWEFLKKTHSDGPTIDVSNVAWPHSALTYIGNYLYDILIDNISFNADSVRHKAPSKIMSQGLYHAKEKRLDVKQSKQIRAHSLLCKLYRDAKLEYLHFDVNLVPMLSPPHPWVKYDAGGLLITTTPFIRFPDHAQHQVMSYSKVPSHQLNPCFDSLNGLSLCPWIINQPILDIVIDVFQKGGNEELDIPLHPGHLPKPPKVISSMSKKEKAIMHQQKSEFIKNRCEITSLWFDCLYKLSIANHFRNKTFWFPHNLDFRGRVYPTAPHFNHLGSDMARSILLFADGQRLGKNGLNWLKIHLINLTGFKKRDPHTERLKFANEMLPEILDSADHPFDGRQWWKTSDKPWQTLACCKEVSKAVRHPNPEEYISHFPVHQDGSCNGLQHYAALGRDELGAIEVNLHPSATPQDVYSGVAALVEKERQKDAACEEIAQHLEGFVKRKVVKQTVMTFVYGVTAYGAKLQILKQLKDIPEFPERYYHEGATYLMKKTFFSIREMFTATKHIQDWFTDCAEQITRVSGDTLEWITPLGLPVIQPYHKEISVRSSKFCISQGKDAQNHYSSIYEPYQRPNIRKQKNAFAPNFIHSLDSSHMMLTSLFCQRNGITFVSVHDCFWTHASEIEVMNKVCREQFVSLHSEPILENLSAFFLEKYNRVANENIQPSKSKEKSARLKLKDIVTRVPNKGTFDLRKVLNSEYFFS